MIRCACKEDIESILRLLVQVNMVHHAARPDLFKGPATKYSPQELERMLDDPQNPVFVYEDEAGRMAGYIFCQSVRVRETALRTGIMTLYIDDLCVDEEARGKHVGEALYRYVLDYASARGYYNVTLHVWEGNDGARRFYDKMGMKTQYTCLEQIL